MDADASRLKRLRLLGVLLALLSLAVVGVSAYLRLAGAGLGCADWPACYGRAIAEGIYAPPAAGRLAHRIVATSALLLVLVACWVSLRPRALPAIARPAFALLGLMLLLSVVGIWSRDPSRVPVNFVNIVGGLALVPLAWRMAIPAAATGPRDRLLSWGMLALGATVLVGAWIGASYAGVPANDGQAALHLGHRGLAVLAVVLLGIAGLRRRATALLVLLALEASLGMLTLATDYALWIAVGHNLGAAALLAAVAQMRR